MGKFQVTIEGSGTGNGFNGNMHEIVVDPVIHSFAVWDASASMALDEPQLLGSLITDPPQLVLNPAKARHALVVLRTRPPFTVVLESARKRDEMALCIRRLIANCAERKGGAAAMSNDDLSTIVVADGVALRSNNEAFHASAAKNHLSSSSSLLAVAPHSFSPSSSFSSAAATIASFSTSAATLESQLIQSKDQVASLTSERDSLISELQRSRKKSLSRLTGKATAKDRVKELEKELQLSTHRERESNVQIEELMAAAREVKARLVMTEGQMREAAASRDVMAHQLAAQIEAQNEKNEKTERAMGIAQLRARAGRSEKHEKELETKLKALEAQQTKVSEDSAVIEELRVEVTSLKKRGSELQLACDLMTQNLKLKEEETDKLRAQLNSSEKKRAGLAKEVSKLLRKQGKGSLVKGFLRHNKKDAVGGEKTVEELVVQNSELQKKLEGALASLQLAHMSKAAEGSKHGVSSVDTAAHAMAESLVVEKAEAQAIAAKRMAAEAKKQAKYKSFSLFRSRTGKAFTSSSSGSGIGMLRQGGKAQLQKVAAQNMQLQMLAKDLYERLDDKNTAIKALKDALVLLGNSLEESDRKRKELESMNGICSSRTTSPSPYRLPRNRGFAVVFPPLETMGLKLSCFLPLDAKSKEEATHTLVGSAMIKSVSGFAKKCGKLQSGNLLVSVNGRSTLGMSFNETLKTIKGASKPATLRFLKVADRTHHIVVKGKSGGGNKAARDEAAVIIQAVWRGRFSLVLKEEASVLLKDMA